MSKIAASVEDVLANNTKQTSLVRNHCLKLLRICEEMGIKPEVLLFELYASVAVGEELLRLKHMEEAKVELEDDLTEDEVTKLEEDLSKVLKCLKTETAIILQSSEGEKEAGGPKKQQPRNNEEQEYVPNQERPPYIW